MLSVLWSFNIHFSLIVILTLASSVICPRNPALWNNIPQWWYLFWNIKTPPHICICSTTPCCSYEFCHKIVNNGRILAFEMSITTVKLRYRNKTFCHNIINNGRILELKVLIWRHLQSYSSRWHNHLMFRPRYEVSRVNLNIQLYSFFAEACEE